MRERARREIDTGVAGGAASHHRRGRAWAQALVWLLGAVCAALVAAPPANGQSVVGCLLSGPEEYWPDMWLAPGAGRLYIADWTNARVLIHDTDSLAALGEISLSSYLPDRPQQVAGHEGTGTLYVVVDQGAANQDSTVLVVDTATLAVSALTGLGENLTIQVDEAADRLFAFGRWSEAYAPRYTLTAVEVASSSVLGRVDIQTLMDSDAHIGMTGLNPVTGEILFVNGSDDRFVIVNGRTLVGEMIAVPGSAGWWFPSCGTWNWLENKLYITTHDWGGYFIYDRDTGASTVTSCINDGTYLFFSAAKNRVYSSAEVNSESTVIDGASDACQTVEDIWGPVVGLVEGGRRAYFVGLGVTVLDEDSLTIVGDFPDCIPPPAVHRAMVDHGVAVDQAAGRVFARIWEGDDNHLPIYPGPEADYACVLVLQDDGCSTSISPSSASYGPAGGSGEVTVTAAASCSWTATSNAAWITVTSGGSGTGDGTVGYSVAPNSGSAARTGTVTIAGNAFTVTQSE
jgi:hypothetical protein